MTLAARTRRIFCSHSETLIKVDRTTNRLYTECLNCFHESNGIITHPVLHVSTVALNQFLGEN